MPLNLGFIGGGLNSAVGYTHFVASKLDGHFEVSAGCFSRDPRVNTETGHAYGVASNRVYAELDQLLAAESGILDAVCILTPTPDHADMVVKCLRAGFNVICEKALATSVEECQSIDNAQKETGKFVAVTFNYAGYPMIREFRNMVTSGQLGQVQQIYCEMPQETFSRAGCNPQAWRRRDYAIPCVSLDLGVHVYQLVTYVTGAESPKNVLAKSASFSSEIEVVDTVNVLSDFEPNSLASMMWGKSALGYRNGLRLRVFCERGALEWCQSEPEYLHFSKPDGSRQVLDRGQEDLSVANLARFNRFKAGHPAGFIEAFANIYADFCSVLNGRSDVDAVRHFTTDTAIQGIAFLELVEELSRE